MVHRNSCVGISPSCSLSLHVSLSPSLSLLGGSMGGNNNTGGMTPLYIGSRASTTVYASQEIKRSTPSRRRRSINRLRHAHTCAHPPPSSTPPAPPREGAGRWEQGHRRYHYIAGLPKEPQENKVDKTPPVTRVNHRLHHVYTCAHRTSHSPQVPLSLHPPICQMTNKKQARFRRRHLHTRCTSITPAPPPSCQRPPPPPPPLLLR